MFLNYLEKMMKGLMIVGALFAALFSSASYAWDCSIPANWSLNVPGNECYHKGPNPNLPAPTTAGNVNKNKNSNTNTLGQGQTQGQGQVQAAVGIGTGGKATSNSTSNAQGGSSSAKGGNATGGNAQGGTSSSDQQQKQSADNAGNQQISNYNSPRIPVNTAIAGIGMTTAGCRFAEGVGIQGVSAGGAVGFSFKDKDCERFQLAQYLYSRGQNAAGDTLMCKIKVLYKALGSDCLTIIGTVILPPPVVQEAPAPVPQYPPGESERRQQQHGFPKINK